MTAIAKPGTFLITLVFPLDLTVEEGGPPHYVQVEHYAEVLPGWTKVLDEVPKESNPLAVGRDRMVVWKKD